MKQHLFKRTSSEDSSASPKHKIERWEIGWYVLFILGPIVYIAPLVIMFFVLYSVGLGWFFLVLAILGIILYPISVFLLLRMWKKAGDPNAKPFPIAVPDENLYYGPKWNAGIVGMALYHGLFGGRH